jgi:CO dehydrogenase maturation factor
MVILMEEVVQMNKISVCGKGGSGKSTVVALLAKVMRDRGYKTLVVDSDESNPGLYRMLGFEKRPNPLLELVGGKKNVFQTLAPNSESSENILRQDFFLTKDLPRQYVAEKNGIQLVCIGKILQSLEGCACPMGALCREFLKRLRLQDDEIAVIDMEAGIEHFGRGVETSVDSLLIVVEPSFDALELAVKINTLASEVEMKNVWAVLNQIPSVELGLKLSDQLKERDVNVIGTINYDEEVFLTSLEGRPLSKSKAEKDVAKIIDFLLDGKDKA